MKNLNERRDELAAEFKKDKEYLEGYLWFFDAGFDAAVAELKPEIEKLVKALEFYASEESYESTGTGLALHWVDRIKEDQTRIAQEFGKPKMLGGKRAREALTNFKEFMGDTK